MEEFKMNVKSIKVWLLITMLAMYFMASGCTEKVTYGERSVCKQCGKLISEDIKTKNVQEDETYQYTVRTSYELCSECLAKKKQEASEIQFSNPDAVAVGYFEALRNRDLARAAEYCDVSILDEKGVKFAHMPFSPNEINPIISSRISEDWHVTKIFKSSDEPGIFFLMYHKMDGSDCVGMGMHKVGDQNKWKIFRTLGYYREIKPSWVR